MYLQQIIIDEKRVQALKEYYILDTLKEVEFDRITELASIICETPVSLISLLDDKRQWFKSNKGFDFNDSPIKESFCKHTLLKNELFQVNDASKDPLFAENELVTDSPGIRFYAGFPLIDPAGFGLGSLCVIDYIPRKLTQAQQRALELLATEVVTLIVKRKEREQLQNLEKLFNLSDDLICIATYDGYFKKVNPSFMRLLGYTEAFFLTTSYYQLLHPDDVITTSNQKSNLLNSGASYNFVNRYKTKQGDYKVIQWITVADPEKPVLYAIGRDITEKISQEKELQRTREILEKTNQVAQVGGWELNLEDQLVYWTSMTRAIHEVDENFVPDLATGINFYNSDEDKRIIIEAVNDAITNGQPFDLELNIRTAKGNVKWVRTKSQAEVVNGKVVRLIGTFQDITQKKQEAMALQQSALTINHQNNKLLNFAHIVSHNLRTHTGNVHSLLNLVEQEPTNQQKLSWFPHLREVSDTLNETIENLNELVQVQTNVSPKKSKVLLQNSFNAATNALSAYMISEDATITANFDAVNEVQHVPAYVESIMLNFISNAIKYRHPDRKPVIYVSSQIKNGRNSVTYTDNGIGIDLKKNADKMFGMYNTFHNHPDARGIGLFITKNQVEALGGSIEVESELGVGTTFKVTL